MSLNRMLQVLLPQPGDDLRSWASSLVAQLQFLLQQQANDTSMLSSAPATAPLYQSDGNTLVITDVGEYKLADGTVIVDADGLHVKDATGFDVINGPTIRIDTQHLVDAAIETAKLAAGAVTNTIIADNSISTGKLQANSVVAGKIAANAIVAGDGVIGNAAIVNAQIANLDAAKINAGDIAAARMSTNIVTALTGKFATLSALAASLGVVSIQAGGALLTQGVTNYTSGTGLWVGENGGLYKLRIGNPAGARLDWDGSSLNIYGAANQLIMSAGTLVAQGGGNMLSNSGFFATVSGAFGPVPAGWGVYNNAGVAYATDVRAGGVAGTNIFVVATSATTGAQFGIYTRTDISTGGVYAWTPGVKHTISVWVKAEGGAVGKTINLLYSNMGFTSSENVVSPPLTTGWQRYQITAIPADNVNTPFGELFLSWDVVGSLVGYAELHFSAPVVCVGEVAASWAPSYRDKVGRDFPLNSATIGQMVTAGTITGAYIANATIGTANIIDANITTAKIGDLQVNTLKIADSAVSSWYSTGPAGGSVTTTESTQCTLAGVIVPANSLVHASFTLEFFNISASPAADIVITIKRDGNFVGSVRHVVPGTHYNTVSGVFAEPPSAGTYTYTLHVRLVTAGPSVTVSSTTTDFVIAVHKK